MNSADLLSRIGPPKSPISPVKSKEDKKQLLSSLGTLDPPNQLRLALALGVPPANELLAADTIILALSFDDCWRFTRQLSSVRRSVDATGLFSALRSFLRLQSKPNIKQWIKGLMSVAKQWQGKDSAFPNPATVEEFLGLIGVLLQGPVPVGVWRSRKGTEDKNQLAEVLDVCFALCQGSPTVKSLSQCADILAAAVRTHSLGLTELNDDRYLDPVGVLWTALVERLNPAVRSASLDDVAMLLQALSTFPGRATKFQELVRTLLDGRAQFDSASVALIAKFDGANENADMELTLERSLTDDIETSELARVLIRAWDAAARSTTSEELLRELSSTLDRLFGIRLFGVVGDRSEYHHMIHEFESQAVVGKTVVVLRPGVERVSKQLTTVVFKAVVKPAQESA